MTSRRLVRRTNQAASILAVFTLVLMTRGNAEIQLPGDERTKALHRIVRQDTLLVQRAREVAKAQAWGRE
jgi:hypothetical protein